MPTGQVLVQTWSRVAGFSFAESKATRMNQTNDPLEVRHDTRRAVRTGVVEFRPKERLVEQCEEQIACVEK